MLSQIFSANLPKSATQYGIKAALALSLLLAIPAQAGNDGKQPSPTPAKASKGAKDSKANADKNAEASASPSPSPGSLDVPIPPNVPVKGLKVPLFDDKGQQTSLLVADVATKIDPTHIEWENMRIDSTSDDGKKVHVELPHSILDTDTRILNGDKGVLIKREDFEITGDTGEFFLKTRFAKIQNNVKMTIYSLPSASPTPTPTSSPTSKTDNPAK